MPARLAAIAMLCGAALGAAAVEPCRVVDLVPAERQPHGDDPAVIFYDDFDQDRLASYLEPKDPQSPHAARSEQHALGGRGAAMQLFYAKGKQGVGGRKLVFGDCPFGRPVRKGERFTDIHWRIYVKHQAGWQGAPDKMSRATGFVSSAWNQAFISHVWSNGAVLTLDPASGVRGGSVVTTKYNDFANLRWLGNSPKGSFAIHAGEHAGRWVCVESRLRLNTPGKADGYAALWVDGRLDAERTNMDFRGAYDGHGINAVFLEAYWNQGSPVDQYRWYDDFVVSTRPIGPVVVPPEATLILAPAVGCEAWELQLAPEGSDEAVIGLRTQPGDATRVTTDPLPPGVWRCQTRQKVGGTWSAWSEWHQPFRVLAGGAE